MVGPTPQACVGPEATDSRGESATASQERKARLQRELDMAEQSARHRRDEIDAAAAYYAAEVSRIKQIAERINRSAAQQERQQRGTEA